MAEPGSPGDRTPPQDMAAEQSVLGAMMISKDAIADVAEVLRGVDFYRPTHETIHDAIIDLYGRGEPADMVTVANELQRKGELQRIGGAPYLHTISASVPIAANAAYYAEIVREKAILRRLVDAGTRIVQYGYAGEGEVDDLVDAAQAEVYKVTDRRSSEDYAPLSEIMDGVLDEIEAIGNREAGLYGVPTGFVDLALSGVAVLDDAGACVDQAPQDRLLAHDLGVVGGVGSDRHRRRDGVQVGGATDPLQLTLALQLVGHRDHVGRLAPTVEVDDRVVDRLVGRPVEVDAAEHLGNVGDRVLGDHHRPEHGLLRGHVLGRGPVTARPRLGHGPRQGPGVGLGQAHGDSEGW